MNRRKVLAGLLLAVMGERAQAQRTSKVYRIAYVDPQTAVAEQRESPLGNGFFDELHRLGYVEGRNLVIEQYSSEERAFRNPALARAVVERNPDAVVASTNPMCSISKPPRARSRLSVLRPIRWHSASCRILRGREATSRE